MALCHLLVLTGLSPRVRGNPKKPEPAEPKIRSIPAGAGEPSAPDTSPPFTRVYPRGCGGTGR